MALEPDSPSELSPLHLRVLNFLGEDADSKGDSVCRALTWTSDEAAASRCMLSPEASVPLGEAAPDLDSTFGSTLLSVLHKGENVGDLDVGWEMQTLRRAMSHDGLSGALPAVLVSVPSPARSAHTCSSAPREEFVSRSQDCSTDPASPAAAVLAGDSSPCPSRSTGQPCSPKESR